MSTADFLKKIILVASTFVIAEFVFSCSSDDDNGEEIASYSSITSEENEYCGFCTDTDKITDKCSKYACVEITDSFNEKYCLQSIYTPGVVFESKEKCEDKLIPKSSSSSYASSSSTSVS